ncbi:hypothetical protein [Motiliproteus sp. MSK22-1]|uniref:hypothetical protein n=1 Tax=Motiliproteus sp. MSK22-1 TaxID=1897630 RepID=UPI0009777C42|nr:hypothetical protein [Motiliproteus sp. MSK22-1]OMH31792.1 hypothetical protein BGP75_16895 [Motiliproteus sp. MSK22-1]
MKKRAISLAIALAGSVVSGQTVLANEVGDLKIQIDELQKRLEMVEQADEKVVKSKKKGVTVQISGQVNRGIQLADDGVENYTNFVDSDNSSTRVRFIADAPLTDALSLGAAIEMQVESNSTFNMNQTNSESSSGSGTASFTERRLEVMLTHKDLGKLWLGQGWSASDGTAESDLSGTALAASSFQGHAAGFYFRDAAGNVASDDAGDGTIDSVYYLGDSFDGLSRTDRLRYDTPSFGGFSLATSLAQGDRWDLAARYNGKVGGSKISASLGYADAESNDSSGYDSSLSGSVSVLFPSGFNVTLASSSKDLREGSALANNNADPQFYYTKLGYQADLFSIGKTSFSVDYVLGDEQQEAGEEMKGYGFQAVQKIQQYGTELYFALSRYDRESMDTEYQSLTVGMLGARVKF